MAEKAGQANIEVYESPDSTICECCRVSVAMKGENVFVMFRNQLYGKRDLYIITSKDHGHTFSKPEKLGLGTWTLNGCPMDGGDLIITPIGKVQTVWRRESKIYSCEPGGREVEIGEGKACTITNVGGKKRLCLGKRWRCFLQITIRNYEKFRKRKFTIINIYRKRPRNVCVGK
jgi:hypothetical protein